MSEARERDVRQRISCRFAPAFAPAFALPHLLPASHAPGKSPPNPVHDGTETPAMPWYGRVLDVLFINLVPKAIILVAPPRVELPVLRNYSIMMTAARDALAAGLNPAELLYQTGGQTDRDILLPQLSVEARTPCVNPSCTRQGRNHNDSGTVPGSAADSQNVPIIQCRYGLRFPPAFVVPLSQPPPRT